ncbi:hypothetical protein V8G54_028981 [Vigna mungo]|uniref:Uncharacterized protein n=1 Tax=Vigna mungo TaxID=3915 RepID=A0AAQ3MTF7_VIGMU
MRNPCPPSTSRQNELQRRAKAYLTLRPRKGDFKQHKSSLGNCVVSNPILFLSLLLLLLLLLFLLPLPSYFCSFCSSLYLVGETFASGCNHNPTSSFFPSQNHTLLLATP